MKVEVFEYAVTRDAHTKIYVKVPAYEAAVMAHIFGKVNVEKSDAEAKVVDVDPDMEAARLVNRFGEGVIAAVYGAAYDTQIENAIEACAAKLTKKKTASGAKKAVETTEAAD